MGSDRKPGVGKKSNRSSNEPIDLVNIEERRQAVRHPTFKAGEVILDDGTVLDCVIRNVSDSGCLIKIENANALPSDIKVRIDRGVQPRRAEIIWRTTSLAGAMFIREPS